MKITVYHNIATDLQGRIIAMMDGYQAGHPLVPVETFAPEGDDPRALANQMFHLFNVGDDPDFGTPDPIAVAYRKRKNRSLSVGDVVQTRDASGKSTWLACASFGWEEISEPKWFCRNATVHGTTPLDRDIQA